MKWFRKSVNKPPLSDQELLRQYQESGSMDPLTELYNRYLHLIYGVCLKYLKHEQDSQDMCLQVYEKLPRALQNQEIRNFGSWLHVLTKNECLMQLRSASHRHQQRQDTISEDTDMELAYSLHHTGDEELLEAELVALEKALKELPPEQERCLRLFYLEERSYQEISQKTNYSLKQVKSYLQNGKRNLKKQFSQRNEEV